METGRKSDSRIVRIVRFVGTAVRGFYLMRCIFRIDKSSIRVVSLSEYWTCMHYIQQERNPRKLSANAKITFFVPINLLIVLISHVRVRISLNIRATDCDFVYNYLDHQCLGIAVRDDMTNINLEITNDTIFNVSQHLVYPSSSMRSIDHG